MKITDNYEEPLNIDERESHSASRGVSISRFSTGSVAKECGMKEGDVITEYDGRGDLTSQGLWQLTATLKPEPRSVQVRFLRDGHEDSVTIAPGPLGIWAVDVTFQNNESGPQKNSVEEQKLIFPWISVKRIGIGVILLLYKIGPKILAGLTNLFKTVKVGKIGLAGTSMAAYSYLFTWEFALMIMFMLLVHESGHIWAMKHCGLKTRGMYFIPLLGAAAVSDEEFPSRDAESFIALMGPIWGFALAALTGIVYFFIQNPLFAAGASWMAMINLINLLPISPLDGGRVFKSIAYSLNSKVGLAFLAIGLLIAGFLAFSSGMTLFLFLLIVGTIELAIEYKRRVEIPKMSGLHMLCSLLAYITFTGMLWFLMSYMKHVPGADIAMDLLKAS